jgi:hypothetical protein
LKINLHKSITLEVVDENNLELLRELRNNSVIQEILVHKGLVSSNEQKKWFDTTDKIKNIYFLIYIESEIQGYALLKNIDDTNTIGEPGIFLISNHFSSIGGILTISFLDFCHDFFGINYFFGNVLNSNNQALMNYTYFDTKKEEKENEVILKAKVSYSEMKNINKLRGYIQKWDGYNRIFSISSLINDITRIPSYSILSNIKVLD